MFLGVAVGAVASLWVGNIAIGDNLEEVTVVGARKVALEKTVGGSPGGATIREISISYGVSYAGLDLATSAGATELEKRVNDAANAACKDIGQQRPLADLTPDEAGCAKIAAAKAMTKVHALVAAAGKGSAK